MSHETSFVKVFTKITKSTVWEESLAVRVAWLSLLLEADRDGEFSGTREALARRANMDQGEFNAALDVLMSPDPRSTSPAEDGRRVISTGPNQWRVVNYLLYRERRDADDVREKTAERVRKHRERNVLQDVTLDVTLCNANAEAEAEAEADKKRGRKRPAFVIPSADEVRTYCKGHGITLNADAFVDFYASKGWRVGLQLMKDWQAAARNWARRDAARLPQTAPPQKTMRERADEWARQNHPPVTVGGGVSGATVTGGGDGVK